MTAAPLALRCSELPLAFVCPGSVRRDGLTVDESGDEAGLGKAAHEALATLVETGHAPWAETGEFARRHGVDERELRALLALGRRLWAAVSAGFPRASTERALIYTDPGGAFVLTGHVDVIAWDGRLVRIADWKTGRRDSDYSEQLRGYSALALATYGYGVDAAHAVALWVRDGDVERYTMSPAEVEPWLARVRAHIVGWDGRYRVGPHCAHCPRNHECPAGLALVRRDVSAIAEGELATRLDGELAPAEVDDLLARLEPAELVALLARADLARVRAGRVRDAIRAHVARHGDVIAAERRLTLQTEERRSVDLLAAFPVLVEHGFDDADMAEVLDVSLAAALRVAAGKAPRGKGAAASRELEAALSDANAITTHVATKLIVRRS
jgi:hypothetical protein